MTSPEIIEEEGKRLLDNYFDKKKIKQSDNPYKEFLRQVNRMKQLGIVQQLKENYTIANKLFKQLRIKNKYGKFSLGRKEFKAFSFGAAQKSLSAVLKAVAQGTGKRQVISHYKKEIHSFEKWHGVRKVLSVRRNIKGRFVDGWNR